MDFSDSKHDLVGYALVGFGRFCRNRLIPAFSQISGSRIVALYKRDLHEALQAAREFGIPRGYNDYSELLRDPQIEAVYITSANADHEWQAVRAAGSGKHVLCEKPLATSVAGCRNMIQACRENGVKLMVAQTLRFSPAVRQVKEWLATGKLGRIKEAGAFFTYDGTKSPRSWLYDYQLAGGGVLMDIGVHCIDTLRYLLGEIIGTAGVVGPAHQQDPIERMASIFLRFESGAFGSVFCSYDFAYGSSLEIVGEHGKIVAKPFTIAQQPAEVRLELESDSQTLVMNCENAYGELIESFSRAVRGQGDVAITGEEGLRNIEIIEGIYSQR